MCLYNKIAIIHFLFSQGRYMKLFSSSNDKYFVILRDVTNVLDPRLKNGKNSTYQPEFSELKLTILWKKNSHKFIRVAVSEEDLSRILFAEDYYVDPQSRYYSSFIKLPYKPVICVINIVTYENAVGLMNTVPMSDFLKLDRAKVVEKELEPTDMQNFLNNDAFFEVTITDGENKMPVNKLILSARSSVFGKMFQHPWKENLEKIITITDIPFEIMKVLVVFMYSGIIKIESIDMMQDLYIAADKYDLQNLKEMCLIRLEHIDLNHVLDILVLANMYGENRVKLAALNFIAKCYLEVRKLEHWGEFKMEYKDLATEIKSLVYWKI